MKNINGELLFEGFYKDGLSDGEGIRSYADGSIYSG